MKHLLLPCLAGMMLASCASQDVPGNSDEKTEGNRYMAINIVANSATSRDGSDYDNGDADEYAVIDDTNIIFYFFKSDGSAYPVKDGTNIITGSSIADISNETTTNVSLKKLMVVLENQTEDELPTQVVAVINPSYTVESSSVTLAQVKANTVSSFTAKSNDTDYFMMSNSVYNDNGTEVYATEIKPENLATSSEAAKTNAVNIYVERVAAKVSYTKTDENDIHSVSLSDFTDNKINVTTTEGSKEISTVYAKIVGWNLFNTATSSTVLKDITSYSPSEPTTWQTSWTNAGEHRSFWALVSATLDLDATTLTYNGMKTKASGDKLYVFENTLSDDTKHTSIAFAAELYTDQSCTQSLEIGKFLSNYYDIASLKNVVAGYLGTYLCTYDNSTWTPITTNDFEFVTCDNGYQVKPQFTDAGKNKTWYNKNSTTALTTNDIPATVFDKVPTATIWGGGKCYYYTTIKHKIDDFSADAVVRNHWYKVSINTITGLGTPVYSADASLTPVTPGEDNEAWYLDARINVLAWRAITNSVDLVSK